MGTFVLIVIGMVILIPAISYWLLSQMSSYNRGMEYEKDGKIREAIDCYSQALKENPSDHESKYRLFLIFEGSNETEQAFAIARELAEKWEIGEKKLVTLRTFLLNYHMSHSDLKAMYMDSRKLCFLGARNFNAYLFLAKVFGGNGRMEEFCNYIEAALKQIPGHSEASYLQALFYFSEGMKKEARKILESLASRESERIKVFMALAGNFHFEEPQAAVLWLGAIDEAVQSVEDKYQALILLGICMLRLKKFNEAMDYFNRILDSQSHMDQQLHQIFLFSMAWCLHLMERTREAEEVMKKLVSVNFSYSDSLQKLSMSDAESHRSMEEQFKRIYASFPKASLLNELSVYNGMDLKNLDKEFRDWRSAFEGNSKMRWVQFSRDFQDMTLNEFGAAARYLISKLGYRLERELESKDGMLALGYGGEPKAKALISMFPWGTKVSDIVIAEMALKMTELGLERGILLLPGGFSNQARIDAEMKGISLFDGTDIDGILARE